MSQCAHRRCRSKATQAYDVWKWWGEKHRQTPKHYEVCSKHARYFTGVFDASASQRVQDKLVAS